MHFLAGHQARQPFATGPAIGCGRFSRSIVVKPVAAHLNCPTLGSAERGGLISEHQPHHPASPSSQPRHWPPTLKAVWASGGHGSFYASNKASNRPESVYLDVLATLFPPKARYALSDFWPVANTTTHPRLTPNHLILQHQPAHQPLTVPILIVSFASGHKSAPQARPSDRTSPRN